eukprot:5407290-Karenia_brevis.AAC.1
MGSPCIYTHPTVTCIGWRLRALFSWDANEDKHITVLNRLIDLRMINGIETITYEPDPRPVDVVLRHLGLEKCRGVDTPGDKSGKYYEQKDLT